MAAVTGRIGRVLRRVGPKSASPAAAAAASPPATPAVAATAAKKAPVKKAPAKKAPVKEAGVAAKIAPAKKAPARQASPAKKAVAAVKPVPVKKLAPAKKVAAAKQVTPAAEAPAKKAPVRKAPPAKKAPADSSVTQSAPEKKSAARVGKANAMTTTQTPTVPQGTDWSADELLEIRGQLVAELAEMQGEYDKSMQDITEQQAATDGAGDDQADAGSKTFEREQELSIAANRLDLMTQIGHAIERIDAGTYGMCESCGKPIPKARLKAFPMATLDVACKQREERRG